MADRGPVEIKSYSESAIVQVGFDTKGQFNTGFPLPRHTSKIFTLCNAFLTKEDTLSAGARTVYTEDIRTLFTAVSDLLDLKSGGESQRVLSSEEVKALDKQAAALIKKIHRAMVYEFGDTPAEASKWGFDIKQTGQRSGTILMPIGREAIVRVLAQYAKTEKARPASARFKTLALAEVDNVVAGLQTNLGARQTGESQRASGTQQTLDTAAKLLDLLQAAAVQIVVKQFDCKVTPELGAWGFEVTARTSKAKKNGQTPTPPVE